MVEANIPAGETVPAAVDNNAGSKNAPGAGETITLLERPQWVPEKFFKDGVVNFKDMAASYAELEGKQSKPAGEQAAAANTTTTPDPNAAPAIVSIPGIVSTEQAKYTAELQKDGKLSPASYEALAKVGYPKVVVDSYIKGMTAEADTQAAVNEARIADKQIAEIQASVGGTEVMAEMIQWATANLDAKDLKTYNEAVCSADVSKVKLAVQGLFHAYSQTVAPSLLQGNKSPFLSNVEPFKSNDEVVRAMQDPRYDRDQAYRNEVAERIRVSDVFGQSRDLTKDSFARYQS